MTNGKRVLLAFGKGVLTEAATKTLREAGFKVSIVSPKSRILPDERYEYIVQLGSEPRALIEGTRRLLEKAKKEGATFLLISDLKTSCQSASVKKTTACEALHFAEAVTQEFHRKYGTSTAILRLPTLYGPGVPLKESGSLGELISEFAAERTAAKPGATLTVYGDGKDSQYYLYLTDAAEAIKVALNADQKAGTVYDALPPAPLTSIAIANTLRKMGGNRHEIKHHRGLVPLEKPAEPEGKSLPRFEPKTPLEEGILKTLDALAQKEKPQKGGLRINLHPVGYCLQRSGRKLLVATAAALLLLSPLLYVGGRASCAARSLVQASRQLGDFDLQAASRSFATTRNHLSSLYHFLNAIPLSKNIGPLRSLVLISQGGAEIATAAEKITAEGGTITTLTENLLESYQGEETQKQGEEEFTQLSAALAEAEDHLIVGQLYLSQIGPPLNRWFAPILDYLQQGTAALKLGRAVAAAAPDLLGYHGERNYLILFQNSAEIRAGGGFLGSLARLTLENGKIKTLEFFDSYQFDTVGTPAPEVAQRLLFVDEFTLREANFYASFPESAQVIGQLFEEVAGLEIDGVIGTNLLLAKDLIALFGPLELQDFERTITADNLFTTTTEEVEKDFFPGSTKKKRFLQALGEGLLNKLLALERRNYLQLAQAVWEGLEKKDILLSFEEEGLTQVLLELNFDGRVQAPNGDFLMVLDSNYGTKANAWVERSIDYKIFNANRENEFQGELTITWDHTGTAAWPSGTYGNLFRALVPKGSRLIGATLDDKNCLGDILITEEAGKTEFVTSIAVEPQTTAVLRLNYLLPATINVENKSYTILVQKQPGTAGDSFTFSFEEPFGKRISGSDKQGLQRQENSLIFKGDLEHDLVFEIDIEKEGTK